MIKQTSSIEVDVKPKSKCGRKSKLASSTDKLVDAETSLPDEPVLVKIKKKCGRKPKSGKIVHKIASAPTSVISIPNIILELNCLSEDSNIVENCDVVSYGFNSKHDNVHTNSSLTLVQEKLDNRENNVDIQTNLKNLQFTLQHTNANMSSTINDSACFWCTCDFSSEPIYIPKSIHSEIYCVYGCFCSPECAAGFLLDETLDSTVKFERYHILNNIYHNIFKYSKNIKPAPNPFYTLNKFCGNLSIEQYRNLYKNDKLLIAVNKPLTRIVPEIHTDNGEFIINNKLVQKKKSDISSISSMFGKYGN
jgi:hypothetical protein